jgi:hypothetical protein
MKATRKDLFFSRFCFLSFFGYTLSHAKDHLSYSEKTEQKYRRL